MRILYPIFLIVVGLTGYASDSTGDELASKYEVEDVPPDGASIQQLQSFQHVAATARTRGVPIVVMFCSFWCKYCDAMEQQVLKPMMLNDKYRKRILLKKLEVDSDLTITDFDGAQYRSDEISKVYNVKLYPTVVFFDANGREVSQRIVGMPSGEYVFNEFDGAIDKAVQALKEVL